MTKLKLPNDYDYYTKFIRTMGNPSGEDFMAGKLYPILSESEDGERFFIQSKKGTNQVAEFPKDSIGKDFVFSDRFENVQ